MSAIAYFGPSGTFTEMALDRLLARRDPAIGHIPIDADVRRESATSPPAVIEMVRSGAVDLGCVPMESSVEGAVPATMDALVAGPRVQIFAETVLDISFTVAAHSADASIATIAAYPVAAGQTRASLERLFPSARVVPAASNAAAAADVADGRADAALTTPLAAVMHSLTVVADCVADSTDATTRFVLLGRPAPAPPRTGDDRTSVILDLPNEPGSLMRAMSAFAGRGIDLTRIESRPRRRERGYYFYLDAAGHIDDLPMAEALAALHAYARTVTFLGSWPAEGANGAAPPDQRASLSWVEALRKGRN